MTRQYYQAAAAVLLAFTVVACAPDADDDATMATTDTTTVASPGMPAAPIATGMLDPDAATKEELMAIPGMAAELADAVIAGRPYADMMAFDAKLGTLTEAQRDTIYTRVWKPIDLNKATGAEMKLIPGVGERMEHEFMEYRPWTTMEQFRREIGKYVDAAEVARLEKYVRI